jgi:hypothetical protein
MMKISLWQQFSSNHSASFTVVGTFETPEAAYLAAEEIRRLLAGIVNYYADPEHKPILDQFWNEGGVLSLTPVEQEFAQKYGIDPEDWTYNGAGIDWIVEAKDIDSAVEMWDEFVVVGNVGDTWLGAMPIDTLLNNMGGSIAVEHEWGRGLQVNVSCVAPDEATAAQFESTVRESQRLVAEQAMAFDVADISREGLRLRLIDVQGDWSWMVGVRQFKKELEARGCTEIKISFEQIDQEIP